MPRTVAGVRIAGFRFSWISRRWWLLALSAVVVTAVALAVERPGPTRYTAEALLLVRSGASENTPGNASGANQLAVTYAGLIPQDAQVLGHVALALGSSAAAIEGNVGVSNDPSTSILRAQYTSESAELAVRGARALADALAGPAPATPNFSGVGLSRLPESAWATEPWAGAVVLPAIFVGSLLGVVLAVAWGRSEARIDDPDDLADEVRSPVSALDGLSNGAIVALLERWRALALDLTATVAVAAADGGHRTLTAEVAAVLADVAANDPSLDTSGYGDRSLKGLTLHSCGAPGTGEVGESVVQHADLTVLVVPQGLPAARLHATTQALADFGVSPAWVLFASSRLVRRSRQRRHETPVVVDIGVVGQIDRSLP